MAVLGTVGIADKGDYNPSTTYAFGNSVYYEGSTWVAKKDNLTGITPEEGVNWKYLARGFGSDNLGQIEGTDTSGVLGTVGAEVASQALIDAIADRVMTKLIPYTNIANNFLATDPKTVLSGPMGKSLKDQLDTANYNLTALGNKLILNADCKYLAQKQYSPSNTGGNSWLNVSLSQLGITGKKLPEYCTPIACVSWTAGNSFWVTYCHRYNDTTLQVGFNTSSASAFRITLTFGLIDA